MPFPIAPPIIGHPFERWLKANRTRPSWLDAMKPFHTAAPRAMIGMHLRLHATSKEVHVHETKFILAGAGKIPERITLAAAVGTPDFEDALRIFLSDPSECSLALNSASLGPILNTWVSDWAHGNSRPGPRSLWVFRSTALLMPWSGLFAKPILPENPSPETSSIQLLHRQAHSNHDAIGVEAELNAVTAFAEHLRELPASTD